MSKRFRYQLQTPRVAWMIFKNWFLRGITLWILILISALIFFSMQLIPAERLPYQNWVAIPTLADRIRWMGMLFQFAGVLVIIVSLRDNLRLFGENSMFKLFFRWLLYIRFAVIRMPPISASVNITDSGDTLAASATIRDPATSLDEKVAQLERTVKEIQRTVSELAKKDQLFQRETKNRFDSEADERRRGYSEIERKLKTATVGGVAWQLGGVFYLLVGILFTSIPDGVASIFQRLGG